MNGNISSFKIYEYGVDFTMDPELGMEGVHEMTRRRGAGRLPDSILIVDAYIAVTTAIVGDAAVKIRIGDYNDDDCYLDDALVNGATVGFSANVKSMTGNLLVSRSSQSVVTSSGVSTSFEVTKTAGGTFFAMENPAVTSTTLSYNPSPLVRYVADSDYQKIKITIVDGDITSGSFSIFFVAIDPTLKQVT